MITFEQQELILRAVFPSFQVTRRRDELVAVGDVQPSPRSTVYTLRVTYRRGGLPEVEVVAPQLVRREPGGALPHVYPDNRLCLYLPGSGEWNARRSSIAQTIIPWAIEWLLHYEMWRVTGEWTGGGVEHDGIKSPQP